MGTQSASTNGLFGFPFSRLAEIRNQRRSLLGATFPHHASRRLLNMNRQSMTFRFSCLFLASAMLTASMGCGSTTPSDQPELGQVSGTVTLDSSPLADATVSFQSVDVGRMASGKTDSSGYYELTLLNDTKGGIVGSNQVFITTAQPGEDGVAGSAKPEILPKRYHKNSELTREVKPGSNEFNFDLESK